MYDFIHSILNIIGDNLNKLINLCFGKKKEEPTSSVPTSISPPVKTGNDLKLPSWTRKKK